MDNEYMTRADYIEIIEKLEEEIKQYKQKLADGRMVELPCKVGDMVYVVFTPKHPADENDKGKWFSIENVVDRILYGKKGMSLQLYPAGTYSVNEIGKKVFVGENAKDQAEQKLKEMEESK